ncbi:MAG: hypothetical protein HZA03_09820 [Nitrospinae bacterium]|nr:hypothetical protein [Nitrospinota bacterium]
MNVWDAIKTASKGSLAVAREAMGDAMTSPFMMKQMGMMGMKAMRMLPTMKPAMPGMMMGHHSMMMMASKPSRKHTPMHRLERGRHGTRGWNK